MAKTNKPARYKPLSTRRGASVDQQKTINELKRSVEILHNKFVLVNDAAHECLTMLQDHSGKIELLEGQIEILTKKLIEARREVTQLEIASRATQVKGSLNKAPRKVSKR